MNEKKKVGIIGYGGILGQGLLKELGQNYNLRLGQRHINKKKSVDKNIEIQALDLFQEKQLQNFLQGLDAVVNCAGPSWHSGNRVALAAADEKVVYIDAFGADSIAECLKNATTTCIIGAGVFPGFSGIFPQYLCQEYGITNIESLYMLSFSSEKGSVGSVTDLILSSIEGFGKTDHFYKGGQLKKVQKERKIFKGFEPELLFREYINRETISIAQRLGANEAHWINVRKEDNNSSDEMIKQFTINYCYEKDIRKLMKNIQEKYLSTQDKSYEEYRIGCYIEGRCADIPTSIQCVIYLKDSVDINAIVLTQALAQALEEKECGFKYAYEFVDLDTVMKRVKRSSKLIKIESEYSKREISEIEGEI